jgi:phosphatidylserine/phosphatidylglycerophosphate/cardiolipin synthase-like enzyme
MVYSFTDNVIADELLGKIGEGVIVRGFFDKSQNSKWSVYPELEHKADVEVYGPGVLHNKVFIIDNETVVTGSYNPTNNGNENNDENMLVLHDKTIAASFLAEFSRISNPKAI